MKRTENKNNILVIQIERFPDTWKYYDFGKYRPNKKELLKYFKSNYHYYPPDDIDWHIWAIINNEYEWLDTGKTIDLTKELDDLLS